MSLSLTVLNIEQYGFLGPIVGIAGVLLAAATAITFGWTGAMKNWKPPTDVLPEVLSKMVTMVSALTMFFAWILARPNNEAAYIGAVGWLGGVAVIAFLAYVGLRQYCGRFRRPLITGNQPSGEVVVWGGFWLTRQARQAVNSGETVEAFLAGNNYKKETVWPPGSLTLSAMFSALVILTAVVSGTSALSTAATATQVVLTKKPAREIFGASQVPGLPPSTDSIPSAVPR